LAVCGCYRSYCLFDDISLLLGLLYLSLRMLRKLSILIVLLSLQILSFAQGCSTCRAQIESSQEADLSVGQGLNMGIIFLMIVPYIILYLLFRKKIKSFFIDFKALQ
jgi:hypothetical protein